VKVMTARLDRSLFSAGTPEPGSTITVHGVPGRVVAVRDLGPDEIEVDLEPEDPPSLLGVPGDNQLTIEDTP
jgi:hypothetical protein